MSEHRLFRVGPDDWTVFDVHPEASGVLDPALVHGWLCFEHDFELGIQCRRLAPIPEGWQRLSDAELALLWESALPVARIPPAPSAIDSHIKQLPKGDPARARRSR